MQPLTSFEEFERFLGRFTNYERLQHFRYDKKTLGLTRIRSLAAAMGDPQRAYPIVHIAGTKGKGSTSLLLEALLLESGYRVGTYTSPHVEHLTERVRLNGRPISEAALVAELNALLPVITPRAGRDDLFPSFFELMTALALGAFRRERVDWGILEVGLGGRLDATNIVEPRWTAITTIGLEHTAQLGTRLGQIAREKAGIIKPGVVVFIGELHPEAEVEIRRVAREKDARVVRVSPERVRPAPGGGLRLDGLGGAVVPAGPVLGPALRADLALALELYRSIRRDDGRVPEVETVRAALESAALPGRVEVFPTTPCIVLDSAHTSESLRSLGRALEEIGIPRPRTAVFALSKGKELAAVLSCLPEIAEDVIFTRADETRSIPPAELREHLDAGEVVERPEAALARAMESARPVVVTGSFYLSGRLRPMIRNFARTTT